MKENRMNVLLCTLLIIFYTEAKRDKGVISPDGVDVYPEPFNDPVLFANIYREGPPIAQALLDPTLPPAPETRFKNPGEKPPDIFASPRDKYEYLKKTGQDTETTTPSLWIDLPAYHSRNVQLPKPKVRQKEVDKRSGSSDWDKTRRDHFKPGRFGLRKAMKGMNWTTCEEFAKGASFHPDDIVDIDWVPFYMWSVRPMLDAFTHRFSHPTQKVVNEYKETYGPYVDEGIDWDQPKLLLKYESNEFLLIAGDRKGLYNAIQRLQLPESIIGTKTKLPFIQFRFKIEDPYLVMMQCNNKFAVVMAVAGQEPLTNKEKILEADTINFRGKGRPVDRSYEIQLQKENALFTSTRKTPKFIEIDVNSGMHKFV